MLLTHLTWRRSQILGGKGRKPGRSAKPWICHPFVLKSCVCNPTLVVCKAVSIARRDRCHRRLMSKTASSAADRAKAQEPKLQRCLGTLYFSSQRFEHGKAPVRSVDPSIAAAQNARGSFLAWGTVWPTIFVSSDTPSKTSDVCAKHDAPAGHARSSQISVTLLIMAQVCAGLGRKVDPAESDLQNLPRESIPCGDFKVFAPPLCCSIWHLNTLVR